jgi:hypothetical protein
MPPEYVLSLSYGKDSLACLGAIKHLGLPLDRIVHAEVWATDTIPADLPPMVEFKKHADKIIKQRYGIEVEHICALKTQGEGGDKQTYESMFYHKLSKGKYTGTIKGFPQTIASWCKKLKYENGGVDIRRYVLSTMCENTKDLRISSQEVGVVQGTQETSLFTDRSSRERETASPQVVQYLGIASDEPLRIARHINRPNVILPLVEIGWEEDYCGLWCQYNDLLSPIYTDSARGGCWFCHNQSVGQLRLLRKNYPDLWALLLKWDNDSPVSFKADGHTVHDFGRRFQLEDEGFILPDDPNFRWAWLDGDVQMKWF